MKWEGSQTGSAANAVPEKKTADHPVRMYCRDEKGYPPKLDEDLRFRLHGVYLKKSNTRHNDEIEGLHSIWRNIGPKNGVQSQNKAKR